MGKNVIISWVDESQPTICVNPTKLVSDPRYTGVGAPMVTVPTPEDEKEFVENRAVLIVDCTTAGEITQSADIAEHPIEDGSTISDHVTVKPKMFSMTGLISNHPIIAGSAGTTEVSLVSAPAFGVNSFLVEGTSGDDVSDENRMYSAYGMLSEMLSLKRLCRIVSDLEVMENMVCQSASFPRDALTATTLKFSLTFKQVKIVSAEYVDTQIPTPVAKDVVQGKGPKDKGKQDTPKAPDKDQSILAALADKMGLLQ